MFHQVHLKADGRQEPKISVLIAAISLSILAICQLQPASTQAAESKKIVPVSQWTWRCQWSDDGKYVAVNWPAPAIVGPDGKLSRVIGKPNEKATMVFRAAPTTVSRTATAPVTLVDNSDQQRTLILKEPAHEALPFELPKSLGVSWAPNSKMLACHDFDYSSGQTGKVYSVKDGRMMLKFSSEGDFAWSPDSKLLAANTMTGIDIWDVAQKQKLFSFPGLKAGMHCSLVWSPDGTKVAAAVASSNNTFQETLLKIVSRDGKELLSKKIKTGILSIGWLRDKNQFIYCDEALHFLDGDKLVEVSRFAPATGCLNFLALAPNNKLIAYMGDEPILHIYNIDKKQEVATIEGEKTGRFSTRWSPDSSKVLLTGVDQLAICNASDGSYLGSKQFSNSLVLGWTPDGKNLVLSNYGTNSIIFEPVNSESGKLAFNGGTAGNPWKDQKIMRNLDDCFDQLNLLLTKEQIEKLKSTPENKLCLYQGGIGLGMALRNTWGLRGKSPLTQYFNKFGITDGASMSSLIIELYWRKLNGMPINLEESAKPYLAEEASNRYIITENRQLPIALLSIKASRPGGAELSIGEIPGTIKIVSFIPEELNSSLELLKALQEIRKQYPEEKVAIVVVEFTQETMLGKGYTITPNPKDTAEIASAKATLGSSCFFAKGTADQFAELKKFALSNSLTYGRDRAQTVIIKNRSMVETRINGSLTPQYTEPLDDAIESALHPSSQ